ncbi:hypothetical protein AWB81_07171 [Caballeronia arationis]|uniref:hypothetical protein n=1 Tax=Caballeronia arationis TaxID=1777142 RepID=UPI00074C62A0|nr:hypothetical protein [Caballeronia arationis]SAL05462.1 hypothetical protein AWB81_07171 [Caballeronia arationis]
MRVNYGAWVIGSVPEKKGHHWHAWVEVERSPWEDEDIGQIFHFTDIGYYDIEAAAYERGIQWARAWLDDNF